MPSLDEDSLQSESSDKNMNNVTAEFIENFSGLKLETSIDRKSVLKRVDKSDIEGKGIDSIENLPEAKISIKEKNTEIVCLSCSSEICCKKSELTKQEGKINLPLSSLLIDRSPDRNGRIHCREGRLRNNVYLNSVGNVSLYRNLPLADLPSQFLHCNGGCFSEVSICENQKIQNLHRPDKGDSPELLKNVNFTDDLFSPQSSAYSSSSSSYDCISPNSVGTYNAELYSDDSGHASPATSELSSLSPDSAFVENITPFLGDIPLHTDSSIVDYLSDFGAAQFTANDDSLFPLLEDSSTDEPPSEKANDSSILSHSSAPKEEINHLISYLKNGDINPITTQLVTHFSESSSKVGNSSSTRANNHQEIKKLNSCQEQINNNKNVEVLPTQLPYSRVTAHSSMYRSENDLAKSTFLVLPVHLQSVAVLGSRDKHQRPIKPSIVPALETKEKRCQNVKKPAEINSAFAGGEYKSVKDKIRASITKEEKNRLLKSALEEKPSENGETKLHVAALKCNEKLAYALVESMRTKLNNETSKTDNPRIYVRQGIKKFVNVQNKDGCTPLYHAVYGGNTLLTAYLLECGADPHIKDYVYGNTPYHIAAMRGNAAVKLMELLSYCRDITDVRNNKGQTVLMAAVIHHRKECSGMRLIKHLLETNHKLSSQDCDGRTALHIAVQKKDIELVEVLLTNAMDSRSAKSIQDNEGNTILHVAATTDMEAEVHNKLLETIMMHCPILTEVANKERKLPFQLVNENRIQERSLLRNKMDQYGFRNL